MKTIVIKTQAEMNALPLSFNEWTEIHIQSDTSLWLEITKIYQNAQVTAYGSSQVTAYGSSQVRACDSSQVTAYDSSQVTAYGSSQVTAYGSSQVTAYGSSQVTACDSSQVRAYGSSQVTAYGSSQVTAYGSSQVTAYGSSQVTAYGSSQVTAYGSSQVRAYGNSMIAVLSAMVVIQKIAQYAIVALDGVKIKLPKKAKTATIIKRKLVEHDINSFVDCWGLEVENGCVILYKTVRKDTLCDFRTGKIKYEGIVVCPDFDSSSARECGGGLHLCATKLGAISFADGAYKLLKCKVKVKDIVVYGKNIEKVRCRRLEVLGEA